MTYKISHTTYGPYRDTTFIATVILVNTVDGREREEVMYVDGINTCVAQLADQKWWLIANIPDEEHNFTDVGPFDDVETAIVNLKLRASRL